MSVRADNPLQQHGYIRLYRAVLDDCGQTAATVYGVLEDIAQISAQNRRSCSPGHDYIAKRSWIGEATVKRALLTLREHGWISFESQRGQRTSYTLHASQQDNNIAQNELSKVRSKRSQSKLKMSYKLERINKQLSTPTVVESERARKATAIDPLFSLDASDVAWAESQGFSPDEWNAETHKFIDHFTANGKVMKSWPAAWRNWMRRSREFAPRGGSNGSGRLGETAAIKRSLDFFDREARKSWESPVAAAVTSDDRAALDVEWEQR